MGDERRGQLPCGLVPRSADQELTGWFDGSASLTIPGTFPEHSAQLYYDSLTSKHMILNNQMKGYGEGCMDYGFYYSAQMMYIEVPEIDWATTTLAAPAPSTRRELSASKHYGKFRRGLKKVGSELCFESGSWDNFATEFSHAGCQMH